MVMHISAACVQTSDVHMCRPQMCACVDLRRACVHVLTEGDAFKTALHDPVHALACR